VQEPDADGNGESFKFRVNGRDTFVRGANWIPADSFPSRLEHAVLDVKLHTGGMTDEQAIELMVKKCFQETEEATAKLQRAKLSSCQLPTYYVGWRGWQQMRRDYQAKLGGAFKIGEFHANALKPGSVPLPAARRLLGM